MTRLLPPVPAAMSEAQRAFHDQIAEDRPRAEDGRLGGPFDAWVLNPDIGRRLFQAGGALRFRSTIDRRYMELAILMTGRLWEAQFEWWAHEPMAREAGLPEEVIGAVKDDVEPSFTDSDDDDGDRTCWRFCRTLLDRRRIDDELYGATVARFGEVGVADLINACGFYTAVSMTLNTFEVPLPPGEEPPFPPR